jgi:hypothetical protein
LDQPEPTEQAQAVALQASQPVALTTTTTDYARQQSFTNVPIDSGIQPFPAGCSSVEMEVKMDPADATSGLSIGLSKQDAAGVWHPIINFTCNGVASHTRMQTDCRNYTNYRIQGQVTGTVVVTLSAAVTTSA